MDHRTLRFIAAGCAGELVQGSPEAIVSRVCTDSRQAQAGDLFIALRGERFDAHLFLAEVSAKGVIAILAERMKLCAPLPACAVIAVDDTRKALSRLASAYRANFKLPLVAVAGSNGKTTTKELVAAVLRQRFNMLWSEASFNNDIGVPLTLLRLEATHEAAVLEVGTNHPGELAPLVRLVRPQHGVITNIGREHLEFFSDLPGVAAEEGALAELLPANGTLFLDGDNGWSAALAQRTQARVVRVGLGEANVWRAREVRVSQSGVSFQVDGPRVDLAGEYRIQLLGRHQVASALFAIGVAAELGLNRAEIQRGLAECPPAKMRMQLSEHNGVRVLDDSYNANADSVGAALQTLMDLPCKGRRVAVLGDMAELGAHTGPAHAEVGRRAAELGVGQLFAVGRQAPVMAQAARDAGLTRVIEFPDVEPAVSALQHFVKPGDLVLLKGSRVTRLERLCDSLRGGNGKRS
jgi:UDP-N-acetylmuramoyl-tripeptide--D-alanyl-D-alanine ligase